MPRARATGHPSARSPGHAGPADLADAYSIDAAIVAPLAELRAAAGLDGMRYDSADVAVLTGLIATGTG
jgi:hypothetical protein